MNFFLKLPKIQTKNLRNRIPIYHPETYGPKIHKIFIP